MIVISRKLSYLFSFSNSIVYCIMDFDCSGRRKTVKNREQSLHKKFVLIRCFFDFNFTDIENALTEMSLKQIL